MTIQVIIEIPDLSISTFSQPSNLNDNCTNYTRKCVLYLGISIYFVICNICLSNYNVDLVNHYSYFRLFDNIFILSKILSVLIMLFDLCSVKLCKFAGFVWIFTITILCLFYIFVHVIFIMDFIKKTKSSLIYLIWEFINNIHYCTLIYSFCIFNINDAHEPSDEIKTIVSIDFLVYCIFDRNNNDEHTFLDEIKTIFCIEFFLFNLIKYIGQPFFFFIQNKIILPLIRGFRIICDTIVRKIIICKSNSICKCNLWFDHVSKIQVVQEKKNPICSICLDDITSQIYCKHKLEGTKEKKLECNHLFHTDCINEWLSANNHCPLCRRLSV